MEKSNVRNFKVTKEGDHYLAYVYIGKDETGKTIRPKARGRTEKEALKNLKEKIGIKLSEQSKGETRKVSTGSPEAKGDMQEHSQESTSQSADEAYLNKPAEGAGLSETIEVLHRVLGSSQDINNIVFMAFVEQGILGVDMYDYDESSGHNIVCVYSVDENKFKVGEVHNLSILLQVYLDGQFLEKVIASLRIPDASLDSAIKTLRSKMEQLEQSKLDNSYLDKPAREANLSEVIKTLQKTQGFQGDICDSCLNKPAKDLNTQELLNLAVRVNNASTGVASYQEIVFNMSPDERIVMPMSEFKKFRRLLLKVLVSAMDQDDRIAVYKLYKDKEDKRRCTYAMVDWCDTLQRCTVHVLGQSDIKEKRLKIDLNEIGVNYNNWLAQVRWLRENYPIEIPGD